MGFQMNIDEKSLDQKLVKVTFLSGDSLTGTVQLNANLAKYANTLPLLPYQKADEFKSRISTYLGKQFVSVPIEIVEEFFEYIPLDIIEKCEIVETEVHTIRSVTENGKELGIKDLELKLKMGTNPGFVNISCKVPGDTKLIQIGDIPIKNGVVEVKLPVVFISYAREDETIVKKMAKKLNNYGIVTWFDKRNLLPGDDWEIKIEEAIEKVDFFLIFLSKETEQKIGYKNRELELALKQQSYRPRGKVFIVPILLDDCTPPHDLKKLNWVKVSDDPELLSLAKMIAPRDVKIKLFQEITTL